MQHLQSINLRCIQFELRHNYECWEAALFDFHYIMLHYIMNVQKTKFIIILRLWLFLIQRYCFKTEHIHLELLPLCFQQPACHGLLTLMGLNLASCWRLRNTGHSLNYCKKSVRMQHERCCCVIAAPISSSWCEILASWWMVDLFKSLGPTQSHSFWAGCGDELPAASNNIYPSDSSSIWFTSQRAHRWGINVPSALPPLLFFCSKRDYFPLHFLMRVYLPLIFGQMHYFPSPRALLVSH